MVVMSAVECPWTKRAMNSKYARIAGHVSGWLAVGSLTHERWKKWVSRDPSYRVLLFSVIEQFGWRVPVTPSVISIPSMRRNHPYQDYDIGTPIPRVRRPTTCAVQSAGTMDGDLPDRPDMAEDLPTGEST